jgi:hypothetical protein
MPTHPCHKLQDLLLGAVGYGNKEEEKSLFSKKSLVVGGGGGLSYR